jgi:hypothetical protein
LEIKFNFTFCFVYFDIACLKSFKKKFRSFQIFVELAMTTDTTQAENELVKLEIKEDDGDVVDPWNVTSKSETGINYDKLICKFYIKNIDLSQIFNN